MPIPADRRPLIIQGGMGAAVSTWRLARAVSVTGQLGVVSGTAIDVVLARRLQDGDPGGHMRRGLEAFPVPAAARRIVNRYFIPGGRAPGEPYRLTPKPSATPTDFHLDLIIAANFVEVFLAREGHDGLIGINLLEKIQAPTIASIYGAMLAGVDVILMGAGIPIGIPAVIDQLAQNTTAKLRLNVEDNQQGAVYAVTFDPVEYAQKREVSLPTPQRPDFFAIISTDSLASTLVRRAPGHIDGFVIENSTAGGHNAPPRGALQLNERGEPIYGPRDRADYNIMQSLERPYWLAGSHFGPTALREALNVGACGIQTGTPFALCNESGFAPDLKQRVIDAVLAGTVDVLTDPVASPAGYPFKFVQLEGTISDDHLYRARQRRCDLGYFRRPYVNSKGTISWRCPAETPGVYVRKGGKLEDTVGRKCLCNALLAAVDQAQCRPGMDDEVPVVTAGDNIGKVARFFKPGSNSYSAADVVNQLLADANLCQFAGASAAVS